MSAYFRSLDLITSRPAPGEPDAAEKGMLADHHLPNIDIADVHKYRAAEDSFWIRQLPWRVSTIGRRQLSLLTTRYS